MSMFLTGCGHETKDLVGLKSDLEKSSRFVLGEDEKITSFSVLKRQTDVDAKSDIVYVSVTVQNETVQSEKFYIMGYSLYNDGWRVDYVEEYYGDDAVWEMRPLCGPTEFEREEALAEVSQDLYIEEGDLDFIDKGTKLNLAELTASYEYQMNCEYTYWAYSQDITILMKFDTYEGSWYLEDYVVGERIMKSR